MKFQEEIFKVLNRPHLPISGKKVSSFQIGGELSCLIEVESIDELRSVLNLIRLHAISYNILGRGSNILLPDQGIATPIIKLGKNFSFVEENKNGEFVVGASTNLIELSAKLSKQAWSGLEFAAGIPASFGGATVMNAGAHGSNLANLISWIKILNQEGDEEILYPKDFAFSYRHSSIPAGAIVLSVGIKLIKSSSTKTESLRLKYLEQRRKNQPLEYPSAGSIFKNPDFVHSAGWLIEQVGLKGTIKGGALISDKHANWIVNVNGEAKSNDVIKLIKLAQEKVASIFNIILEPELKIW